MMDISFSEAWTASRKRLREDQFQPANSLFDVPMSNQENSSQYFPLSTAASGGCFPQFSDGSSHLTRPIHPLPSKIANSKSKNPRKTISVHSDIHSTASPFLFSKVTSRGSPKFKRVRSSSSNGHPNPSTPRASSSSSQKMQLSPEFSHPALPFSVSKPSPQHTATSSTVKINPNHRCHVCNRLQMLGLLSFSSEFTNCEACNQPTCSICMRECVSCDEKVCSGCSQEKGDHTFCHACAALNKKWALNNKWSMAS